MNKAKASAESFIHLSFFIWLVFFRRAEKIYLPVNL